MADAFAQAFRQGIPAPTRDDVIARLTLGFWTVRVPDAFSKATPEIDLFGLVATRIARPQSQASGALKKAIQRLHLLRNRVAHHEPLALRSKHLLHRDGTARRGLGLLRPLGDALLKFEAQVDNVEATTLALAPGLRGDSSEQPRRFAWNSRPSEPRSPKRPLPQSMSAIAAVRGESTRPPDP